MTVPDRQFPRRSPYTSSRKSQADYIEMLAAAGWREDQSRNDLWRWKDPKTGALHTLRDAIDRIHTKVTR
jgi:hypothetical protein